MAKTATRIEFSAQIFAPAEGGDWTFLRLPQESSDELPSRTQIAVDATLNGFAFTAVLEPDSKGGHWLKIEPAWSAATHARAGDTVEMTMVKAAVEPEPEVPSDLAAALAASPVAMKTWEATTTIARRDWITWMAQGKRADTRMIRLEKMIDMLGNGKKRVCCYDRSGQASKAFCCPVPALD